MARYCQIVRLSVNPVDRPGQVDYARTQNAAKSEGGRKMSFRFALLILLLFQTAAVAQSTDEENYPNRPVRVIVPWPPGGGTDIFARAISDKLQQALGQPFPVENRPGAAGNLGAAMVARSTPDGYTIMIATITLATSSRPLSIPGLRYNQGLRWDYPHCRCPAHVGGEPRSTRAKRERTDRPHQAKTRQADLFVRRCRESIPNRGRAF